MADAKKYCEMIIPPVVNVSTGEVIGDRVDGLPVVIIRFAEEGLAIGLPLAVARRIGKAIYRAAKAKQEEIDDEETRSEEG